MQAILKKGWGYWDITHYPYGGCFKRATENTIVSIVGKAGKYPEQEREILFPDGRRAVAKLEAMEEEEQS